MAGSKTKYVSMVVLMLTALVGVAGGGAFAISLERRHKVEIGNEIRKSTNSKLQNLRATTKN